MSKPKAPPHHHFIPAFRNWLMETHDVVYMQINVLAVNDLYLKQYAKDDVLTLNVTETAAPYFSVDEDAVRLSARFSGQAYDVIVPPTSVVALIGKNRGMDTDNEDATYLQLPTWGETTPAPPPTRPKLSVVK